MSQWTLSVDLGEGDSPLFVRVARAIAVDIARGRLKPGQRLPGTRTLAASLGVNRNTVVAAYEELAAEGWTETGAARGTFVSQRMPDARPRRFSRGLVPREHVPKRLGFALQEETERPEPPAAPADVLELGSGMPDPRLAPAQLIARAYRRVAGRDPVRLFDYGDPQGHRALRGALAEMLASTRGVAAGADDLLLTRGSQMALWLTFRGICSPGDRVVVESFGYGPAWDAIRRSGAQLCPLPVDGRGLDVDALEALVREGPIRAVYLTPHHQYPTTAVLAAERRMALLELARIHRFAIVEDDYDNEFHYEGRPVLPMASVDTAGVVVYVGSLSKVLAPNIRVGWIVAPRPLLRRLTALRRGIDRQGDQVIEAAIADLMEDGDVQRHVWRMKRTNHARRDCLVELLGAYLPNELEFTVPAGGMALWAQAKGIDVERWRTRALERGVNFTTAKDYAFDRRKRPFVRLGFARLSEDELERAVGLMAGCVPAR